MVDRVKVEVLLKGGEWAVGVTSVADTRDASGSPPDMSGTFAGHV